MEYTNKVFIPQVQVRSKSLILYELPAQRETYKRHELIHKTYTGTVTDSARSRILRTVDVFLQRSPERMIFNPVTNRQQKFRLSFITLTIPQRQQVPGPDGHKALKVFLQHFRRPPSKRSISEQMVSYLWKAELQARGQLHYHITTNVFLNLFEIRRVWNGILHRRGWMKEFTARVGHTNPNSTDVHAVYKVKDIQAYLGKYLSKTGAKDVSEYGFSVPVFVPSVGAKVWDCSNDLKVPRFSMELDGWTDEQIRECLMKRVAELKKLERCHMVLTGRPEAMLSVPIREKYEEWRGY